MRNLRSSRPLRGAVPTRSYPCRLGFLSIVRCMRRERSANGRAPTYRVILWVVKIAVSIPDPLFESGDQLARRRKISRSQLYAIALESLLTAEDDSEITGRLNAVYAAGPPADEARPMRRVITVRESW